MAGQALAGLLGPLGQQVAEAAEAAGSGYAHGLWAPLAEPAPPLTEPDHQLGDDLASPQHSEPLPDVVALLELPVDQQSGPWQSPRPHPRADLLPRGPHLEGLRRPPRLGASAA